MPLMLLCVLCLLDNINKHCLLCKHSKIVRVSSICCVFKKRKLNNVVLLLCNVYFTYYLFNVEVYCMKFNKIGSIKELVIAVLALVFVLVFSIITPSFRYTPPFWLALFPSATTVLFYWYDNRKRKKLKSRQLIEEMNVYLVPKSIPFILQVKSDPQIIDIKDIVSEEGYWDWTFFEKAKSNVDKIRVEIQENYLTTTYDIDTSAIVFGSGFLPTNKKNVVILGRADGSHRFEGPTGFHSLGFANSLEFQAFYEYDVTNDGSAINIVSSNDSEYIKDMWNLICDKYLNTKKETFVISSEKDHTPAMVTDIRDAMLAHFR